MPKLAMIFISALLTFGISYLLIYIYWKLRKRKDNFNELMDQYGYAAGKIGLMVFILLFFLIMQYFDLL